MTLSTSRVALALASAALLVFTLTGCGTNSGDAPLQPGSEAPASEQTAQPQKGDGEKPETAEGSQGTASFVVDGHRFDADLDLCMVYENGDEVLLGGPAIEVDGDLVGYLEGDVVQDSGEFRIDLGATGRMQSSDDFFAIGTAIGGDMTITQEGDGYRMTAPAWTAQGDRLGDGSVVFSCH